MNVRVSIYLGHTGTVASLRPLLDQIAASLVEFGLGSDGEEDAVQSIVVVEDSDRKYYDSANAFVEKIIANSLLIIVPTNQREEDSGRANN